MKLSTVHTQRLSKPTKDKIKPYLSLLSSPLHLQNMSTLIDKQRVLRVLTSLQINHFLLTLMDLIRVTDVTSVGELKVGIIGCGVMGRLVANNLIPLTKEGLNIENIFISTRQPQQLHLYSSLRMNVEFNNKKLASQCDIIFVCTPSTLDNWILSDIAPELRHRFNTSQHSNSPGPILIILTTGVDRQLLKGMIGERCNCLSVVENGMSVEKFVKEESELWEGSEGRLSEKILEERAEKSYVQNLNSLAEVLGEAFQLKAAKESHHPTLLQCLQSPSPSQNFRSKCERFKHAYDLL